MKKFISLICALALTLSLSSIAFAAESDQTQYMSIDEYCSSEDYSLEGLQELFPDYYNRCQEAYAQDKALIAEINSANVFFFTTNQNIANPTIPTPARLPITMPAICPPDSPFLSGAGAISPSIVPPPGALS